MLEGETTTAHRGADDAYDIVVVGAGLAGLSAAAALARSGKKVLSVERQDGPGGYAHAFRRNGYTIDPAIHVTGRGFGNLAFWELFLGGLGISDDVELLRPTPFYGVVFPDFRFDAPAGIEEFIEAHARAFPHEAEGIRNVVDTCVRITDETQQIAARVSLSALDEALEQAPTLFRYRSVTLGELLDEHLADERAKALLGASWPYQGLPPSKVATVQFGGMLAALLEKGPGNVRGSFQVLADAFVSAVEANGGEFLPNTQVTRIIVDDGAVTGVVLDGGRSVRAPIVISNADAKQTLEDLVGLEHLPDAFVKRYRRMRPSLSAFVLYTATTLDMHECGYPHETFVYQSWDHDETYQQILSYGLGGTWLSIPTLHDSSIAPEGEHLVTFTTLMPYDIGEPWESAKERYTELMLGELERLVPGIRDNLTFVESATPVTLERYTLNQQGAIYGWENTPNQTLPKRLTNDPPIDGLYLAGHWTEPGSSSFRVVFSGVQAAQSVLGFSNPVDFFDALYKAPA